MARFRYAVTLNLLCFNVVAKQVGRSEIKWNIFVGTINHIQSNLSYIDILASWY